MSNDITPYLEQIKTASYGEQVRDSIYQSIRICYEDGQGAGSVDLKARQDYNNLIARNGGALSETKFFDQDLDIYYAAPSGSSPVRISITLPSGKTMNDYDYIGVYYKVVDTGAAELRMFKREDFISKPTVVFGVFVTQSGGQLRRIHLRPASEDNPNYTLYDVYLASHYDIATQRDVYPTIGGDKFAGVITNISGFSFRLDSTEVENARGLNPDDIDPDSGLPKPYQTLGARLDAIEENMGNSSRIENDTLVIGGSPLSGSERNSDPYVNEPPLPGGE